MDGGVPVGVGEFVQLPLRRKDDQADVSIAQYGQLLRFLQEASAALREADLAARLVFYPLQFNPTSRHQSLPAAPVNLNEQQQS